MRIVFYLLGICLFVTGCSNNGEESEKGAADVALEMAQESLEAAKITNQSKKSGEDSSYERSSGSEEGECISQSVDLQKLSEGYFSVIMDYSSCPGFGGKLVLEVSKEVGDLKFLYRVDNLRNDKVGILKGSFWLIIPYSGALSNHQEAIAALQALNFDNTVVTGEFTLYDLSGKKKSDISIKEEYKTVKGVFTSQIRMKSTYVDGRFVKIEPYKDTWLTHDKQGNVLGKVQITTNTGVYVGTYKQGSKLVIE